MYLLFRMEVSTKNIRFDSYGGEEVCDGPQGRNVL